MITVTITERWTDGHDTQKTTPAAKTSLGSHGAVQGREGLTVEPHGRDAVGQRRKGAEHNSSAGDQKNSHLPDAHSDNSTHFPLGRKRKSKTEPEPTVLCSSPSRTRNVCSNTVYMILPRPKDGSMTFGTISSTESEKTTLLKTTSRGRKDHAAPPPCLRPQGALKEGHHWPSSRRVPRPPRGTALCPGILERGKRQSH